MFLKQLEYSHPFFYFTYINYARYIVFNVNILCIIHIYRRDILEKKIKMILESYHHSFSNKIYSEENNDTDILMNLFDISPSLKRENRQYWGRELGMVWQLIVIEIFKEHHSEFSTALRIDLDEPCDLVVGSHAIDTKYRIGSGDSGTLKKFKQYGKLLQKLGYEPVLLILREDNLPAAIKACEVGGWNILTGEASIDYIKAHTGVDIKTLFKSFGDVYKITR